MKVMEFSTLNNPESWHLEDDMVIEFKSAGDACLCAELFTELHERVSDYESKLTAITKWLEAYQPDVFSRGLWDALETP